MDQCKTPETQLKCSHCKTTGKHNTNDFCKEKQQEKIKAEVEKDAAKANKVEARDGSPTGDMEQEEEDTDSNEEDQEAFHLRLQEV